MKTESNIINKLKAEGILRDQYNRRMNEGATDGYNPHEDKIAQLSEELYVIQSARCPLKLDLAGEKAWFNSQGFTAADLQSANNACESRGYSLADLQAACKAAKAAK